MKNPSPFTPDPPHLATQFLRWYCRSELLDEVEGDLYELFHLRVQEQGLRKAQLLYWLNVLMFFHPDYIRKRKDYPTNHTVMFRNYFKVATRNLVKHKFYAVINVLGLAIGMTCCLLIFLYVSHELSYDSLHTKSDRIYRLVTDIKTQTETLNISETSPPMAANIKTDFPEVEEIVRLYDARFLLQRGDRIFQEDEAMLADSTFFRVFDFTLLKGNPSTALVDPFSIVLTEDAAKKYFGDEDPLGQRLRMEGEYDLNVTGVMQNVPENSNFAFTVLISLTTREKLYPEALENGGDFSYQSYILLSEQATSSALAAKLPAFLDKHVGKSMREYNMYYSLFLEPLSDVYFSDRGAPRTGSLTNIKIFSVIAVFILLIACINFMNMATARATERAKEVGVRKAVGAIPRQLTLQFLCESLLLSLLAFVIALLVSELLIPAFNHLAGKVVTTGIFQHTYYLPFFLAIALGVGLLAGIYPALVLSRFKSVAILRGRFSSSRRGILLRKALVAMQFTISIMLIAGTAVVYTQLNYMRSKVLGFKKDQMLVIDFRGDDAIQEKIETFKQQLGNHSSIQSISASSSVPGENNNGAFTEIENPAGNMQASNLDIFFVDHNFLEQYEMEVVAGRRFSKEFSTDTSALIVNEALAESYGYAAPDEIIGKRFSQFGVKGEVIGVVKDYHFKSLQQEIEPLAIRLEPVVARFFSLNISTDDMPATIAALQEQWQNLAPQRPFNFFFLDESFDQQYRAEVRFGQLFIYFAGLAVFIACLGLLGLISYTVVQRSKEIGIRKVLGATESSIVRLLSRDFLVLVLIAFMIATPIAWYASQQWLADFAYRTPMHWWVFALAGLTATFIAMLTLGFQSVKAALANPIDSLRNE